MAIVNRDLDVSEQRVVYEACYGTVGTGLTLALFNAPWPCEVQLVKVAAIGLSGTPTGALTIHKFIAGAGVSVLTGGWTTLTLSAIGTSGVQSFTQVSSGNSLIQMGQGDVLCWTSAGSGAAVAALNVSAVVKCLVDIKNQFNAF